jgi:hypothetical protein
MKTTNTNATTRQRRASEANRRSLHVLPAAVSMEESPQTTRHTVRTTKNKEQKEGCEVLQPTTFPYKLREMLEHASSCDSAELQSACFWSPDGTAFVISNTDVVMDELVPMFFKQTKFRSFVSVHFFLCTVNSFYTHICIMHKHNLQIYPILLFLLALSNRHDS